MHHSNMDSAALFASLLASQKQKKLPPVSQWNPTRSGRIDMRIGRDGHWYYQGSVIPRQSMVALFASVLRKEGDDFFLVTPQEKLQITVDDAPFTALNMEVSGQGQAQQLLFTTNADDHVLIDAGHRLWVEQHNRQPAPYIHVRDQLCGLILRPVFYRLVQLAVPDATGGEQMGVWSCGEFFPIGSAC